MRNMAKSTRKKSAVNESPAAGEEAGNIEIVLGVLAHAGRIRRDIAPLLKTLERDRALGLADQLKTLAEGLQTAQEGHAGVAFRMRIAATLMQVEVFTKALESSLPIRIEGAEMESRDAA